MTRTFFFLLVAFVITSPLSVIRNEHQNKAIDRITQDIVKEVYERNEGIENRTIISRPLEFLRHMFEMNFDKDDTDFLDDVLDNPDSEGSGDIDLDYVDKILSSKDDADYFLTRQWNINFTENSNENRTFGNDVLLQVSTEEATDLEISSTSGHSHHSISAVSSSSFYNDKTQRVPSTATTSIKVHSLSTPVTTAAKTLAKIASKTSMTTQSTKISSTSFSTTDLSQNENEIEASRKSPTEVLQLTSTSTAANNVIMLGSTSSLDTNTSFVTETGETVTPDPESYASELHSNDTSPLLHVAKHQPKHVKMNEEIAVRERSVVYSLQDNASLLYTVIAIVPCTILLTLTVAWLCLRTRSKTPARLRLRQAGDKSYVIVPREELELDTSLLTNMTSSTTLRTIPDLIPAASASSVFMIPGHSMPNMNKYQIGEGTVLHGSSLSNMSIDKNTSKSEAVDVENARKRWQSDGNEVEKNQENMLQEKGKWKSEDWEKDQSFMVMMARRLEVVDSRAEITEL